MVSLENVSKQFRGGALALQDISIRIEKREFVTFLGPSGCGKSTLLKLVSGLVPATSGSLSVNGF
jgi:NitT/TauT family transport system ATP-binding protein